MKFQKRLAVCAVDVHVLSVLCTVLLALEDDISRRWCVCYGNLAFTTGFQSIVSDP